VGTGDNFWAAMYFLASTLGFVLAYALVQAYYVKPHNVVAWWYLGLLFVLCMVAGVALPGGLVVLLWHLSEKRRLEDDRWAAAATFSQQSLRAVVAGDDDEEGNSPSATVAGLRTTRYGCRPNFEGNKHFRTVLLRAWKNRVMVSVVLIFFGFFLCVWIIPAEFAVFAERAGDAADVGVLVCGPQGLQSSVARECRARNLRRGGGAAKSASRAVFHFNSHSFDL
jgi:ferric-chelate reductase